MKLGIFTADNDFTTSLYKAVEDIKNYNNWVEMLDPTNPSLLDVLAFMTAQYAVMARADLFLLYPNSWPFDLDKISKDREHYYVYLKSRIKFLLIDKASNFPDNWSNGEGIGIDLNTGYVWILM